MISFDLAPASGRSLRLFKWTAMSLGTLWLGALGAMFIRHLALEPGAATPRNPCPSCAAGPYSDVAMGLFIAVWLLFLAAAGEMRFLLFASGPDKARFAASLLLAGLVGLALMGFGLLF